MQSSAPDLHQTIASAAWRLPGAAAAGGAVASAASDDLKALQLECGSNNPAIVRADADVDASCALPSSTVSRSSTASGANAPGPCSSQSRCTIGLVTALLRPSRSAAARIVSRHRDHLRPTGEPAQAQSVDDAIQRLDSRGATVHSVFDDRASGGLLPLPDCDHRCRSRRHPRRDLRSGPRAARGPRRRACTRSGQSPARRACRLRVQRGCRRRRGDRAAR